MATSPHITMTDQKPWNPKKVVLGSVSREQDQQSSSGHEIPIITRESLLQQIYNRQTQYPSKGTMDVPDKRTFISKDRHPNITPEILANRYGIGLKYAMVTITATTQRGTRLAILPIARRYRADRMYQVRRLNSRFAMDTL